MTKNTDEKIIHCFLRLAEEVYNPQTITHKQIAEKAHLSETTVRAHFHSIPDLIKAIREKIDAEILEIMEARKAEDESIQARQSLNTGKLISPYTVIADEILPLIYAARDQLRIIYTTAIIPDWQSYLLNQYRIPLAHYFGYEEAESLGVSEEFLLTVSLRYVMGIFEAWVCEEVPQPPEVFRDTFLKLTQRPLETLLPEEFRLPPPPPQTLM